ncbi:hypothetical protein KP806_18575 [Paenibacillus sp. N4]|uniref:hypothetical protein n=1 Tax=Paenibacillus vietnamensis TaxID=2590547 RepID=UPI001CD09807|nr:hypothetical protein [Paenibacillus vietnamensis]MCA0757071.1 hypothetical protein [Paenibacillus vietnamensis]
MSHLNPDWYKSLQADPLKEKTFTEKLARSIMTETKRPVTQRSKKMLRISFVSIAILSIGVALIIRDGNFLKLPLNADNIFSVEDSIHQTNTIDAIEGEKTQDQVYVTQGGKIPAPTEIPVQPGQGTLPRGTIDISEVPAEENLVPRSIESSIDPNSVLKETEIRATKTDEEGLILRTRYTELNGTEIMFTQAPAFMDEDGTIQFVQDRYDRETVELTLINGHTAAYVDGEGRKVVHFISKDHFFTASTSSLNGTIENCINIMEQIQLNE